jgi:peptidoglycan hydrolase CwlO-like protein
LSTPTPDDVLMTAVGDLNPLLVTLSGLQNQKASFKAQIDSAKASIDALNLQITDVKAQIKLKSKALSDALAALP